MLHSIFSVACELFVAVVALVYIVKGVRIAYRKSMAFVWSVIEKRMASLGYVKASGGAQVEDEAEEVVSNPTEGEAADVVVTSDKFIGFDEPVVEEKIETIKEATKVEEKKETKKETKKVVKTATKKEAGDLMSLTLADFDGNVAEAKKKMYDRFWRASSLPREERKNEARPQLEAWCAKEGIELGRAPKSAEAKKETKAAKVETKKAEKMEAKKVEAKTEVKEEPKTEAKEQSPRKGIVAGIIAQLPEDGTYIAVKGGAKIQSKDRVFEFIYRAKDAEGVDHLIIATKTADGIAKTYSDTDFVLSTNAINEVGEYIAKNGVKEYSEGVTAETKKAEAESGYKTKKEVVEAIKAAMKKNKKVDFTKRKCGELVLEGKDSNGNIKKARIVGLEKLEDGDVRVSIKSGKMVNVLDLCGSSVTTKEQCEAILNHFAC